MPLFKKPRTKDAHLPPLERPYLWLSKNDPPVTGEDICRHIFVSGATGSGKTSSSGKEILKSQMVNGGGIVACSKGGPDGDAALVPVPKWSARFLADRSLMVAVLIQHPR